MAPQDEASPPPIAGLREVQEGRTLLVVGREALDGGIPFRGAVPALRCHVVVAEDDATLGWTVAHRGRTVGRRRLLRGWNAVQPDTTHPRRRALAGGNLLPLPLSNERLRRS